MTDTWWTTRKFAFIGAAVTLTGAAVLSLALAYPTPIASVELGAEWQCTRTAFVWTSCSHIRSTEAVAQSARKDAPCPSRRGLNG
jgi:hypothetical protein